MYGSLTFLHHTANSQFFLFPLISACRELKIAQIAQIYQLFQRLHLVHIYGHGFYELSRMLMRKNVHNDVSKDSPIFGLVFFVLMSLRENGIVTNFPFVRKGSESCKNFNVSNAGH